MKKGTLAVLTALAGGAAGAAAVSAKKGKTIEEKDDALGKLSEFYHLMNQWLIIKQEGRNLAEFFQENDYQTIAVYGMKELGERLCDELKDTGIQVAYAIDKRADEIYNEITVVSPDDDLEKVDAVVVTPVHYFDEIQKNLSEKMECPIVSLEDVVYEL